LNFLFRATLIRKDTAMDLLTFAKNIADRVEAQSARAKVPVAVCVIDIHGNVILKHRMSGAPTFSIELSEGKLTRPRWWAFERPSSFRSCSLGRSSSL
jgi:Haem-degrading